MWYYAHMTLNGFIAYIQTPEGALTLSGILLALVTAFFGGKKIIKKQRSGHNSTNIQGDDININAGN